MVCKLTSKDVLSNLKSWKASEDKRDAITKEFKFLDFKRCEKNSIFGK